MRTDRRGRAIDWVGVELGAWNLADGHSTSWTYRGIGLKGVGYTPSCRCRRRFGWLALEGLGKGIIWMEAVRVQRQGGGRRDVNEEVSGARSKGGERRGGRARTRKGQTPGSGPCSSWSIHVLYS